VAQVRQKNQGKGDGGTKNDVAKAKGEKNKKKIRKVLPKKGQKKKCVEKGGSITW